MRRPSPARSTSRPRRTPERRSGVAVRMLAESRSSLIRSTVQRRRQAAMNPILLLDYAGVAVFAATGALAASRKQLDIIGFLFLASVTGIGGGTFRDLILGAPVFWVEESRPMCWSARRSPSSSSSPPIGWSRAEAAAVARCDRARRLCGHGRRQGPGGDRLADRRRRHRHADRDVRRHPARPAGRRAVGPAAARNLRRPRRWPAPRRFTLCDLAGAATWLSAIVGFLVAFGVRGGALRYGWSFPPYKSRPGRRPEDIP